MAVRNIIADPILANIIGDVEDRRRMSEGIEACKERKTDFAGDLEMKLAGIAMVPEARDLVTERLTEYWSARFVGTPRADDDRARNREIIVGGGLHAAIYAAARVARGFPKPIVLERGNASQVGGAFAVSMKPVFRLNSRNRPGTVGLPNQDKALNYIPGAPLQPSMVSSEEYQDNAAMAWLIRVALAQNATVFPNVTVSSISSRGDAMRVTIEGGDAFSCGRVIDARGMGDPIASGNGSSVITFPQLMERMGGMFPLRGMREVAVIGGGDSAKCAVESLLGIAPGNSSPIGLDYVSNVGWYTGGFISDTCSEFREQQRGRYIRIGQFLEGNVSNPTTRLELFNDRGYATPTLGGVIVNDRTYDMAVLCTGSTVKSLDDLGYGFFEVRAPGMPQTDDATVIARQAAPIPYFKIGPAAEISFSQAEITARVADNPANQVAMFRLAQRTAALGTTLDALNN